MAQQNDSKVTTADTQSPSDFVNAASNFDSAKDLSADMAAPYGTRSRNRGGRVNYAEDKDIEMDSFDYYDKKDPEGGKKSSRKSDAGTNGDNTPRSVGSRRAAAEEAKAAAASQNGSKDTTPGITTSALQAAQPSGAVPGTRKRKLATTTSVPNKKAASGQAALVSGSSWPDTNMLTFDNCNHHADANGRMVADDGTVLEPNGE
ncbi:putative PHD type zinc finger protein with BAH domain-containing protein [Conoideocrella luteorostrata]|uniref:PHD type zinc finger protein with BAH domain-containing protein n=1 Tax=Conoideocrella luteorostrata TaxID=1105319 RepID=A0AAJ0CR09_9HYPO|nr:putative PHD type zinc finger protein with BAH domain-containing protein [Conoideocrella luteorostrata]